MTTSEPTVVVVGAGYEGNVTITSGSPDLARAW
jgi:hypothetical protein